MVEEWLKKEVCKVYRGVNPQLLNSSIGCMVQPALCFFV